jgi:hypothetical protein
MIDKGVLPKSLQRPLYITYLTSAFRTIRFGITEAHGLGQAVQLNYLLDSGAFQVRPDGTFTVNADKIRQGVEGLTREIMTMQAEGNYAKAKEMGERLGMIRPQTRRLLDKMVNIPTDIEPHFATADQLLREQK